MAEDIGSLGTVGAVGSNDASGTYESPAGLRPVRRAEAVRPVGQQSARQPSPQQVEAALRKVNDHLARVNRVLELHVDAASGLTIATIRNSQTGEVLQQSPGIDSLHLAQMLADWSPGKSILLDLMA